ncbi:hypothetical protein [Tenacibaculum sp. M341]|uniref:hypothetical protein n=1 Tax=Tenacibaculum sp. M341 TaxID=2530339 RepID=UPI0010509AD5|nr:hypothetical protein [Tenacibaculum sp. M341]TCI85891.1 hypothetical protein EYW44_15705 [Tenacibaculum sp. M341]
MNIKFVVPVLLFGLIFVACKQENKTNTLKTTKEETKENTMVPLKDFMIGNWETTYIKIDYKTFQKSDSSYVFEDDFSKPNTGRAQSKYNEDGTFTAWFKQPDGSKVGETKGTWKTKGDSLYTDYSYGGKQVQAWYVIQQVSEGFEGKVIYDWDNDTEYDDALFMKSKKIK